jgi:transcriptional regulator with XRE-family HTH domain
MTSLKAFSGTMTASDQTLALAIKRLRVERGITQEALAFQAEVTIATLSRIERGVTNPAWPTLRKIANALAITPVELIAAAEDARAQTPNNN